jgi:hypothetical protein
MSLKDQRLKLILHGATCAKVRQWIWQEKDRPTVRVHGPPLAPDHRGRFLEELAHALEREPVLGDGSVVWRFASPARFSASSFMRRSSTTAACTTAGMRNAREAS